MVKFFNQKNEASQAAEDELYSQIAQEIDDNVIDKGLWAKATANADGNDDKIKSIYIKLRLEQLKNIILNEAKVEQEVINAQKKDERKSTIKSVTPIMFGLLFWVVIAVIILSLT